METATRRRKHWGWGFEDQQLPLEQLREAGAGIRAHLGFEPAEVEQAVPLEAVELPPPRVAAPLSLAHICSSEPYARASHAYGRSLPRHRARLPRPLRPPARRRGVSRRRGRAAPAARMVRGGADRGHPLRRRDQRRGGRRGRRRRGLLGRAVDRPRPARPRARDRHGLARRADPGRRHGSGARGPAARPHGFTLRHFPQSFEFSTLGGWIATRAGGHFATLYTHIDDLVESVRASPRAGSGRAGGCPARAPGRVPTAS